MMGKGFVAKFSKFVCAGLLASAVAGCGTPHAFPHVLHIDSRFTPAEQAGIIDAVDEWETATGGLVRIKPVITDGMIAPTHIGDYRTDGRHAIFRMHDSKLFSSSKTAGKADIGDRFSCANNIWLDVDAIKRDGKDLKKLGMEKTVKVFAMHELGHHFGLQHPSNWGEKGRQLMQPTTDHQTYCISPADLYHFCRIYDCQGYNVKTTCTQSQLAGSQHIAEYE